MVVFPVPEASEPIGGQKKSWKGEGAVDYTFWMKVAWKSKNMMFWASRRWNLRILTLFQAR